MGKEGISLMKKREGERETGDELATETISYV